MRHALFIDKAPEPLPHDIRELEQSLLAEVRAKFGEDVVPAGARLGTLVSCETAELLEEIVENLGNERRIGPDDLRGPLRAMLEKFCLETLAGRHLAETAVSLGLPPAAGKFTSAVSTRLPTLVNAVAAAQTSAEVAKAFDDAKPDLEKLVRIGNAINAAKGGLRARFTVVLAERTGLPASAIANLSCVANCAERGGILGLELAKGKVPCEKPEDVEPAYAGLVERLVATRVEALAKVDAMGLSREVADTLKTQIVVASSFKLAIYDLDKFAALANEMKPHLANLAAALRAPGLTKAALQSFTQTLQEALAQKMGQRLETDENFAAVHAILAIAMDGDNTVADTVHAFFRRADIVPGDFAAPSASYAQMVFNIVSPAPAMANELILHGLGTPQLPPLHAAALVKTARAAGLTAMSDAEILALFAPNRSAGKELAAAVGAAPVVVTPLQLESFAVGALRAFAGAIHDGVASPALAAPETDFPPDARTRASAAYGVAGAARWKADELVAVARDPETGFLAAFAIFAGDRLVAPEFPAAFEKFAAFAQRLADRLDAERSSPPSAAGGAAPAPAPHGTGYLPV